ncbi:beta-defensin 112 isoform X1 [Odocoileus virginianus]|uniref:Beta-defensin n=1 Tax=Odocoileus virginianus TaxID=9874 RepID=A0ABM4HA25_ODOVR
MKILLFFSISFFSDVFIPPVSSRSVGNSLTPTKVPCLQKLEKLYSETRNSSTIFENAQYRTKEKQKARKKFPQYGSVDMRRECVKGNGRCKNQCHASEVRIAYCIRPGSLCCLQK